MKFFNKIDNPLFLKFCSSSVLFLNSLFAILKKHASLIAIGIILWLAGKEVLHDKRWKHPKLIIQSDVIGYYSYLPAAFIYKDLSLEFADPKGSPKYKIAFDITPVGKRMIRYTLGQSLLYSPFFFMAHLTALVSDYDPSGYTEPYKFFLAFSSIFYVILGFFALRRILLRYFPETPVALTLIFIALGTNLYHYYTVESPMTHAYSFALISTFLLQTDNWHKNPNWRNSMFTGLLTGLIALVRPFNILVVIIFIFYQVNSLNALVRKATFFLKLSHKVLFIILMVLIVWIPQFLYWKFTTDHYLFYTYGISGGNFFFRHPHILEGFFGYRKGWFLYNPIMIFAMLGIIWMRKYFQDFFYAFIVFFIIFIYILFSWWSWWYGGGLSIRTLVDIYGLIAVPFAAFVTWLWTRRSVALKVTIGIVMVFFLCQGKFFNWQYKKGLIHWDSMTKEAYWFIMWKKKMDPEFYDYLCKMDPQLARKGIYICCHKEGKYKNMEEQPCIKFQDFSEEYDNDK